MMSKQPEEIIQQKEWHQLSADEKEVLKTLAATEGEYNVLKKMLILAVQDKDDVPQVDPALQRKILKKATGKYATRPAWLAFAAAAAVVFVVLLLFVFAPSREPQAVVKRDIPKQNPMPPPDTNGNQKPESLTEQPTIVVENKKVNKVTTQIKDTVAAKRDDKGNANPHQQNMAAVSTSLESHPGLLAFVTEVY